MDITPLIPKGRQIITGYGNGGFKINQEFIPGSQLVWRDQRRDWLVSDISQISETTLAPLLHDASGIELLLIGTGKGMSIPDISLRQLLKSHGIAHEIMDTGAACRTYNVLLSEERRVAAALIAV